MLGLRFYFLMSLLLSVVPIQAQEILELSPQKVVDLLAQKSDEMELIQTERKYNEIYQARVLSDYDFGFELKTTYQWNKAETVDGFANERDKRLGYSLGVSKKFATGSSISLSYQSIGVNTVFSTYNLSRNLPATQYQDVLGFEIEQNLWRNAFGRADRLAIQNASDQQIAFDFSEQEDTESLVLSAMDSFWKAYIAKESLRESFSSRDRYLNLLKTVRQKSKLGYTAPGELARTEAEVETQEQRVKQASLTYLQAADQLKRILKLDRGKELMFVLPEVLPEIPSISNLDIESLRVWKRAQIDLTSGERELDRAKSLSSPELKLVASMKSTGVDSKAKEAFSELAGFSKPTYYVGLSLRFLLGDNSQGAEVRNAGYRYQLAQLQKRLVEEKSRDELAHWKRYVHSSYLVAKSSLDLFQYREAAAKEIRKAYTQGRLDIQELILAYNALSVAETAKIRSIGEYHMGLNRLSAVRDELVK